jgi:hypothetical protein
MTLSLFSSKGPVLLSKHSIASIVFTGICCWLLCLKLWSLADNDFENSQLWLVDLQHYALFDCIVVSEDIIALGIIEFIHQQIHFLLNLKRLENLY